MVKSDKLGIFAKGLNYINSKHQGNRINMIELLNSDKKGRTKLLKKLGLRLINLNEYILYGKNNILPVKKFISGIGRYVKKTKDEMKKNNAIGGTDERITFDDAYVLPNDNSRLIQRIGSEVKANLNDAISIKLDYYYLVDGDKTYAIKPLDVYRYKDITNIYHSLIEWANSFHNGDEYIPFVEGIYISIIKENGGGCCSSEYKKVKYNGMELKNPKSSNNNCFFACIKDYCELSKLTKTYCNRLRNEVNIESDSIITISQAFRIFDNVYDYEDKALKIINNEDGITDYSFNYDKDNKIQELLVLYLADNHYMIYKGLSENICVICKAKYKNTHTCPELCFTCKFRHKGKCNKQRLSYYNNQILKKKNIKYVLYNEIKEDYNKENIIHYDLETYLDENKSNIPYIVGFTFGKNNFKYIAGDDCMERFVDLILDVAKNYCTRIKAEPRASDIKKFKKLFPKTEFDIKWWFDELKTIMPKNKMGYDLYELCENGDINEITYKKMYINAFNGSNFDHFKLYAEFKRRKIEECGNRLISNNSLMKAQFKNIIFIDLWRHINQSLKNSLLEFGCEVIKGDFDHSKHCRWEDMTNDLRNDCLKYLKSDVMGLKELYDKLSLANYERFGSNLSRLISTSQNSYEQWAKVINQSNVKIPLPTLEQYEAFRSSLYAGRCYKSKSNFKSSQYEAYMNGTLDYDMIDDYIEDLDVNSLYPSAMMYKYPTGDTYKMSEKRIEIENENLRLTKKFKYMSICKINYTPNRYLAHAILPRREELSLKWDLTPNQGWYCSVDIENAIQNGYDVDILEGYYWKKTRLIFVEYIEELYQIKKDAKVSGNKALYNLAKLLMNGLYGKMCQKPIYTETIDIKTNAQFWKFFKTHQIKEMIEYGDMMCLVGEKREEYNKARAYNKPTHLGSFILAYSRRIMLDYMHKLNPYFDISRHTSGRVNLEEAIQLQQENDIYYTDTDSLQVNHRQSNGIKVSDELGDMGYDIQGKIIRAFFIQPKLYCDIFAINKKKPGLYCNSVNCTIKCKCNKLGIQCCCECDGDLHLHLKGKGVPNNKLELKHFEELDNGNSVRLRPDFRMKRIGLKRNEQQMKYEQFSIITLTGKIVEKEIGKQQWKGRYFVGNNSTPHNHIANEILCF